MGKSIKRYFKDNLGILIALAAMVLFLYVYPVTHNTFLTRTNIFNVLRQSASNLMLACGMTMVIILGGIDLSVGSIIAMSGCFAAGAVVWGGLPEIVGILIGIQACNVVRCGCYAWMRRLNIRKVGNGVQGHNHVV